MCVALSEYSGYSRVFLECGGFSLLLAENFPLRQLFIKVLCLSREDIGNNPG